MPKDEIFKPILLITSDARMTAGIYGGRAKCLQRLIRLDMPVPKTVALNFDAVHEIATGHLPQVDDIMVHFGDVELLSVRPSSASADWGGPGAILNIGMNNETYERLRPRLGDAAASSLYLRFIHSYAVHVARLDPDAFPEIEEPGAEAVKEALTAYEFEADEPFPQDVATQLADVLRSMARAWEGTSARLLREAKGAPVDAGLGLVVQEMALGVGTNESGSGVIQFQSSETGLPQVKGRYLSQSQGREALAPTAQAIYLTRDKRGKSLQELCPDIFAKLEEYGELCRARLREAMQIEFTVEAGQLRILDAIRIVRAPRAAIRIAVDLAKDNIISEPEALLRIDAKALSELLHRQVAPDAERRVLVRGIAASPGAATGKIVFSAIDAQSAAARGEATVLVRRETGPEDIRGMHAAVAVLTERGGITSHAAVIGRGLGLPCVVGASGLNINPRAKEIQGLGHEVIKEGTVITLDGTTGEVLLGEVDMVEAGLDDAVKTLLDWADKHRDIGIRANADTPQDARTARNFLADGIGLCRTEHMFFEAGRLTVMREMIFADHADDRRAALERLLPFQEDDFTALFDIMEGQPVCIRLLDPPLHEFLPTDRTGMRDLAEALGLPLSAVTERVEALSEFNPMLGLRGVRLGITVPEIYDMQVRAIFRAALKAKSDICPEIMIPLVSAKREVEIVKSRIDTIANEIAMETGQMPQYSFGVMVETPRAALRAGEIAQNSAFLSFGTNDLTQMTYGLSRDDAGRFMSSYVQQGVYDEDPFHRIDHQGVGELLEIGAERGREAAPEVMLSICGEHAGDPDTIRFVRDAGFSYVSCSPFRVPVARLAAAQCAIRATVTDLRE